MQQMSQAMREQQELEIEAEAARLEDILKTYRAFTKALVGQFPNADIESIDDEVIKLIFNRWTEILPYEPLPKEKK